MSAPPTPPPPDENSLKSPTREEVIAILTGWYRALLAPAQVVELRAIKVRRGRWKPHTEAGFFDSDHLPDLAKAALELSPLARAVYFTLNPLNPDLLARRCNRVDWAEEGELSKDKDVIARRWLLVDADPVRDPHVSASDEEKCQARTTIEAIRSLLSERSWPEPILADSGNGFHLLYRIDLPADDGGLLKRILEALAARFDTPVVKVDQSVFNASRICKLPGTFACKGDHIPTRPHRRAHIVDLPEPCEPVPRELLEQLAAEAPIAPPAIPSPVTAGAAGSSRYSSRLLVARWLTDRGVSYRVKSERDAKGRTVYVLAACPFDPSHADPDACVMQAADGKMSAHCFHNGCAGRGWQDFKERIGPPDPHHYDPPLSRVSRNRRRPIKRPLPIEGGEKSESGTEEASDSTPPSRPAGGATETATDSQAEVGRTRPNVLIDPAGTPVAATMATITDVLRGAGDCYRRADQLVRVTGTTITPVLSAAELAGLLNHHAEVVVVNENGSEFKPLPTAYANTWLNHPGESGRLARITLFTLNPVYTLDWRLAQAGFDPDSGIYHAGPEVDPHETTEHLDRLLAEFCFRTPGDRTNFVAMLLTAILIPHFIGSKPAVLFNGNQPCLGKSVLAQIIAILRDGHPTETATYNPNDEEFEKRLGAIVRRGATTIVIDNAKGHGRNPRIDSACLERSITDAVLSFRLLGYSREIRAENSHIFCLTANTPDVSRDLVTRCVVVGLFHEGDPAKRRFTLADPEEFALEHRAAILGELVGLVERWRAAGSPRAEVSSRFNKKGWGRVIGGILQTAGLPGFLANAETAAAELDDTRREFAYLVGLLADHPQGTWTGAELAEFADKHQLFPSPTREESPRGRITRIGILAGRFVGECFPLGDSREARFQRSEVRKGKVYHIDIHDRDDEIEP